MLTLSTLCRTAKRYALDGSVSEPDFLNALLAPYVGVAGIKGSRDREFRLGKEATSRILNGKEDVPRRLRAKLPMVGLEDRLAASLDIFFEEWLDMSRFDQFSREIAGVLKAGSAQEAQLGNELEAISSEPERFLAHALIAAIKASNIAKTSRLVWQSGTGSLSVTTGDILCKGFGRPGKMKNIVVVPVNTTFDTTITYGYEDAQRPLVSAKTLHGQWLERMFKKDEDPGSIAGRIQASLKQRGAKPAGLVRRESEAIGEYPVGTVAVVENPKALFFLLAASSFDERNNAQSSSMLVKEALYSLLRTYDEVGQGLDMYIPLMGTGLSRACLSHQQSFDLICECCIENRRLIHGNVSIAIRREDEDKVTINF